ncbi:hydrolase [Methylococcus sp. EFPC2]|nr:hydrolase [Methylococcus sp. EFPC2]
MSHSDSAHHAPTPFLPARGLANPHLQTLASSLFRHPPRLNRRRDRLETPDGDFVDLDWAGHPERGVILLLHGLTGSSNSVYIRSLQQALIRRGYSSVALNFRGCGGTPNRLARCYHSGDTDDVHHLYEQVRVRHPGLPIGAVGFSLGGNVLLKWLGERQPDLRAAVAVSVPFLLNRCADRMDTGFSRLYRDRLLTELRDYLAAKLHYLERSGNREEARKLRALGDLSDARSFWEFDGRVIAPLYGFRDAADYYARCSSRPFIRHIRTATLVLHAEDDPFVPADAIPNADECARSVQLEISRHGGHVGFMGRRGGLMPHYWLDARIVHFLDQHLPASAERDR